MRPSMLRTCFYTDFALQSSDTEGDRINGTSSKTTIVAANSKIGRQVDRWLMVDHGQ